MAISTSLPNKPLKLAILGTRGIPARYGGFETFAEELAVRLAIRGIDVTVYCEANGQPQLSSYQGVKLVYLPSPSCGPLTTILFDLRCLWHARKDFDVVYMLGYGAAPFCLIPRLWGSKVWLNVDGIEWERAKWNAVAKLYFKLMELCSMYVPSRVIADAVAVRTHLLQRHSPDAPISVIAYGAEFVSNPPNENLLVEWNLQAGNYYLIVCRPEPENYMLEMLQGYAASSSQRKLVVVANHTSNTPYVQSLLQITDPRIHFVGTVFHKKKLQALRYHAFAYCHGHSVGGTNPSLLEGLGCGNAVIAHDNPFNREVAGLAGCYFSTAGGFRDMVESLEESPEKIAMMRQCGPEIIRQRYTWDAISDAYFSLLNEE